MQQSADTSNAADVTAANSEVVITEELSSASIGPQVTHSENDEPSLDELADLAIGIDDPMLSQLIADAVNAKNNHRGRDKDGLSNLDPSLQYFSIQKKVESNGYEWTALDFTRPLHDMSLETHRSMQHILNDVLTDYLPYGQVHSARFVFDINWLLQPAILSEITARTESWARSNNNFASCFIGLIKLLRETDAERRKEYEERVAQGVVVFDDLPYLMQAGSEVLVTGRASGLDVDIGATVQESRFSQRLFARHPHFELKSTIFHRLEATENPDDVSQGVVTFEVGYFDGKKAIASLAVRPITEDEKAKLGERGQRVYEVSTTTSYVSYKGNLVQPSWFGDRRYRCDGRVMLDRKMCQHMDRNTYDALSRFASDSEDATMEADKAWMLYPYVIGFSFALKTWGRMAVEGVTEIEWRDQAFTQLVLPEREKHLVHSLVAYHGRGEFTDIIDGKGGGCIFLLHGEPGTGKTACAESVAEVLHRPLYSVGIGELGTDPRELEQSLRKILDIATAWNAVILIDEVDVFIEKRDARDVLRNAMVGVFLRLLEYHNGVMFLTTNRVADIDPAFYSRISVALHFEKTSDDKRLKIWRNLLKAAHIEGDWAEELSKEDLNGRQIKNAIRNAQTLAAAAGRDLDVQDLHSAIRYTIDFGKMLNGEEHVKC